MEGIPKVGVRRPIPVRDEPLPGTKTLLCPEGPLLTGKLVRGSEHGREKRKPGDVWGALALGMAMLGLLCVWLSPLFFNGYIFWVTVTFTHVFAVFSGIVHCDTNRGGWAVVLLYGGIVLFYSALVSISYLLSVIR